MGLRWLAVTGQTLAVVGVFFGLGFSLPLLPCLVAIATSAVLNILVSFRFPTSKRISNREAALYLGFDLMQLFALLMFTGGIENPFTILFIAPVTISATSLDVKSTAALGVLAFILVTVLTVFHLPLPWYPDVVLTFPPLYLAGIWTALVLGIGFSAIYAWRIAYEAARMARALEATRSALAREHQLAALGGLAAAAAHELGTPLATIALVAKELEREIGEASPYAEDVALLHAQVARCRDIMSELSRRPGEGDAMVTQVEMGVLLDEVAAPHQGFGIEIAIDLKTTSEAEPYVRRLPELVHGLRNLVENAVDFANVKVVVEGSWTDKEIALTIRDDGPGFAPEVLAELGEPFISTRPAPPPGMAADADPDEAIGMGLGFFIAKTLLERTGARIEVDNPESGGARIQIVWRRMDIEATRVV